MKNWMVIPFLLVIAVISPLGCSEKDGSREIMFFLDIGQFSVESYQDGTTLIKDGAGRSILLVPRGKQAPPGFEGIPVVYTPVKKVVAFRYFDVSVLKALGVLDTLVGVTIPKKDWCLPEILNGMDEGRIVYLGRPDALDFELLKKQGPELVLTWDLSVIPMLDELGIPSVVTTTPVAMCLSTRMRFVEFMAPFFNKQKEAKAFLDRIDKALSKIRDTTHGVLTRPKVMWGDIYEKRVFVEPGNSWIAQLVALVNSDYLFKDIYGASCIEINLERFLYSGKDADIYFTYRTPQTGATSQEALRQLNPLISNIKPLGPGGRVYCPRPEAIQEQDRLDEIFLDIAAILHPDLFPDHEIEFFMKLPDHDPDTNEKLPLEEKR